MSKHEPVRNNWSSWFEVNDILAFLYGGFIQHEKLASDKAEFEDETSLSLGVGIACTFHMI